MAFPRLEEKRTEVTFSERLILENIHTEDARRKIDSFTKKRTRICGCNISHQSNVRGNSRYTSRGNTYITEKYSNSNRTKADY